MPWAEIIITIISCGALTALIKGAVSIIKKRMDTRNAFPEAIKRFKKIYEVMEELKAELNCNRVKIITMKNGGGVPVPGSHLYSNILYEAYDSNLNALMPYWQNRRVDKSYIKLLSELEEQNCLLLDVKDIEEGTLKDTLNRDDIKGTIMAKIGNTKDKYYYLSCDFVNKKSANLRSKIDTENYAFKIKSILLD